MNEKNEQTKRMVGSFVEVTDKKNPDAIMAFFAREQALALSRIADALEHLAEATTTDREGKIAINVLKNMVDSG